MRFLMGVIHSRRLGNSLGINLFTKKTCNLDCLYCEAGKTTQPLSQRTYAIPSSSFREELFFYLKNNKEPIDIITFSGIGEPTLCKNLAEFIAIIRSLTTLPIAVITNGILLLDDEVFNLLQQVEVVMPSLDAVDKDLFDLIDRPVFEFDPAVLVERYYQFKKQYKGKFYLEIMLIAPLNTTETALEKLRKASEYIGADRVFLNVLDRVPAYPQVRDLMPHEREVVKRVFSKPHEILL